MTEKQKKLLTELSEKHPEALKLFTHGDFYESYQQDAEELARILSKQTTEDNEGDRKCAFPQHALDWVLPKLIREGHRVCICDDIDCYLKPRKERTR